MNAPHTPPWLHTARSYVGLKEIPGPSTAPKIRQWLKSLNAWWSDDETPWCGTFCAAVCQESGLAYPKAWYRAKAWLDWGQSLPKPETGCIVVFDRKGGGHVGFVTGRDAAGRLLVVGGNQGNEVNVRAFALDRVLGYRWPLEAWAALEFRGDPLPLLVGNEPESRNEA